LTEVAFIPHDELLAGDTLKTITLNAQWRIVLVGAINEFLANDNQDALTLENQQLLGEFFADLYD
jgi:hypothetical protein